MDKNKKRKRRLIKSGWFFISAIILFLAVYLGVSFLLTYGSSITTVVVKKGTLEDLVSCEGYIFKNSELVISTEAGYIDCLKKDDEKVKKGEAVVSIYKNEVDANLKKEISDITEKISALEKSVKYKTSIGADENKSEQSIAEEIKKIGRLTDKRDIQEISQIKKNINSILLRRTNKIDDNADETELQRLRVKLSELKAKQNEQSYTIYAQNAGTFVSKVDGTEELMSLKELEQNGITHKKMREISRFKPKTKVVTKVDVGEPVGKLVDNYKWVLVAEIPVSQSELLNVGDEIHMRFSDADEELISGTITGISGENSGNVIVKIKSNKYSKTVYRSYKSEVQLIRRTYSGIKVPQEALRVVDGKKGVYVLRGDLAKFIAVDIKYSDDNWVVVAESDSGGALKLYDEVILKGRNLYNEKVVK